jgi:hypothetical protein
MKRSEAIDAPRDWAKRSRTDLDTQPSLGPCAELCEHAARYCDAHGDDLPMRTCAEACRRCADACHALAAATA